MQSHAEPCRAMQCPAMRGQSGRRGRGHRGRLEFWRSRVRRVHEMVKTRRMALRQARAGVGAEGDGPALHQRRYLAGVVTSYLAESQSRAGATLPTLHLPGDSSGDVVESRRPPSHARMSGRENPRSFCRKESQWRSARPVPQIPWVPAGANPKRKQTKTPTPTLIEKRGENQGCYPCSNE